LIFAIRRVALLMVAVLVIGGKPVTAQVRQLPPVPMPPRPILPRTIEGYWWSCGVICSPWASIARVRGFNRPELVWTDGTTVDVADYWVTNGQLHYVGPDSLEHTADFSQLDVERTKQADAARGFLFVIRDEPIAQYLQDHQTGIR